MNWNASLDGAVRDLYPTMTAVKIVAELSERFGCSQPQRRDREGT
jgi:hypothetical protein